MVQTGDDDLVEYGYRGEFHITITTILCTLLEIVDTTIVNVALTNMRGSSSAIKRCCMGNYRLRYCKCYCNSNDQLAFHNNLDDGITLLLLLLFLRQPLYAAMPIISGNLLLLDLYKDLVVALY